MVALGTDITAVEVGPSGWLLLQSVEDGALARVGRSEFQHVTGANEAHRGGVVEVDGTWATGGDAWSLEAGLGEHQNLGRRCDVQFFQDRAEVAELVFPRQVDASGADAFRQPRDGIVSRCLCVTDGVVIEGQEFTRVVTGDGYCGTDDNQSQDREREIVTESKWHLGVSYSPEVCVVPKRPLETRQQLRLLSAMGIHTMVIQKIHF